jgi:hypothetical protein
MKNSSIIIFCIQFFPFVFFLSPLDIFLASTNDSLVKNFAQQEVVDPFMGDYQGKMSIRGSETTICAQVISFGEGKYKINFIPEFDSNNPRLAVLEGKRILDEIIFAGIPLEGEMQPYSWNGRISHTGFMGKITGTQNGTFSLNKVTRLSSTLGLNPPESAIILSNGKNMDGWASRKYGGFLGLFKKDYSQWQVKNGVMEVEPGSGSSYTKQKFNNFKLHIEFRIPFMPLSLGQNRGNSGVYLSEKYEVQVLDSYGLEGKDNECGGIYKVAAPRINMCSPPGQWQTYDITFYGPTFDERGNKIKNAVVSVIQNNITIHENLEIPNPTGGARFSNEKKIGGLLLQDHGDRVQYRNIWLVELPDK